MGSSYVFILLFLEIFNYSFANSLELRVPDSNIISNDNLTLIPDISNIVPDEDNMISSPLDTYNYQIAEINAQLFYETLPQAVLEDAKLMVPDLVKKYGYPCETHKITTVDGYILTMHRIPHGRNKANGTSAGKPVVFVQHGLLSSSADWIIPGPDKALAYILADAGYDVWLPNSRGSRYSRNHETLDPDNIKFWDFSWHEIAVKDVPALIDYALKATNEEQLYYVGHSQGTTVFYVMCSERPEYNAKIKAQFSLAPIAYMNHMTSPLMQFISYGNGGIELVLRAVGVGEFLPNTGFLAKVGQLLCSDSSVTQILCTNSLFAICGFSQKQMNQTLLPIIMGHTPAGSSTKQLLHYAQEIRSGKFRQWDYGRSSNLKNYNNSAEPPRYGLYKVTAPVFLFYSTNDWLSAEKDVARLYGELGNVKSLILVPDSNFNHMDYLYAIGAPKLVYSKLLSLIKEN